MEVFACVAPGNAWCEKRLLGGLCRWYGWRRCRIGQWRRSWRTGRGVRRGWHCRVGWGRCWRHGRRGSWWRGFRHGSVGRLVAGRERDQSGGGQQKRHFHDVSFTKSRWTTLGSHLAGARIGGVHGACSAGSINCAVTCKTSLTLRNQTSDEGDRSRAIPPDYPDVRLNFMLTRDALLFGISR